MTPLKAIASEIILRGRTGSDDVIVTLGETPVTLQSLPVTFLIGLGLFMGSAAIATAIEFRAERAHKAPYSAARF